MFLAMAAEGNTAGNAALAALNIPYVAIGSTDLTGNNGNLYVNMNGVTFFRYSDGTDPRIWATDSVGGNFTSMPYVGETVPLTSTPGGSIGANFDVTNWNSVTWSAAVEGGGTLNLTAGGTTDIEFMGGTAGTVDSATTFSGTGAGVARVAVPQ